MKDKQVECPNCLGSKEMFDLNNDAMVPCTFCKGEGEVAQSKADMYDPVAFEFGSAEDFTIEEDDRDNY